MTHQGDIPANQDVTLSTEGVPVGGIIPYAGQALPAGGKWDWADGGLIDRTTYAAFFGVAGHAYNGGVDPGSNMVRKPDKRGRGSVGADAMGGGAAAGRLTTANGHNNGIGQNGGTEKYRLAAAESGVNSNAAMSNPGNHGHGIHVQDLSSSTAANNWPNLTVKDSQGRQFDATTSTNADAGGHTHAMTARQADSAHENMHPYEVDNYIVRVA